MPSSAHTMLLISGPLSLKQMWRKFNPATSSLSIKKLCFRWWWTQFLQTNSLFFSLALNWGSIYLNYCFHLDVTSFIPCHWYSNYYVTSSVLIDIMNTIRLHSIQSISAGICHRKCVSEIQISAYRIQNQCIFHGMIKLHYLQKYLLCP
jgi:hypothetical protein